MKMRLLLSRFFLIYILKIEEVRWNPQRFIFGCERIRERRMRPPKSPAQPRSAKAAEEEARRASNTRKRRCYRHVANIRTWSCLL